MNKSTAIGTGIRPDLAACQHHIRLNIFSTQTHIHIIYPYASLHSNHTCLFQTPYPYIRHIERDRVCPFDDNMLNFFPSQNKRSKTNTTRDSSFSNKRFRLVGSKISFSKTPILVSFSLSLSHVCTIQNVYYFF